ncbi:MerR family transcriptional regulator [Solibacillus silvestris]|uniref:MerR family transcriptional regulator n=1 Tax=Solibacillus silvestris TaxID=76853 RepID=UPI003F801078
MFHINEFKKLGGVSVRTLRYYDKIELLKPVSKTDGGHRLYSNSELKKLQLIQFLKTIGFKLGEIKNMLESDEWDWSNSLTKQLSYVLSEKDRLSKIEASLRGLINGIAIDGEEFEIKRIMELYNRNSKETLNYKLDTLNIKNIKVLGKLPNMSSSDPDSLEWIALVGQLKKYMHLNYDNARIQNIIRRMDIKKGEDFEGEDTFLDKLWDIRKSPEDSNNYNLYPLDQDVLEFMEKAYLYYLDNQI